LLLLGSVALVLGAFLLADRGGLLQPGSAPPAVPDQPPPASSGEAQKEGAARLNPLEGLTAERFTAMLERPLFNAGRAPRPPEPPPPPPPPPVEVAEPEPPPPPPGPGAEDFTLVAVANGPSGRVAAVRDAASGKVLYLREGQPVQQWNVLAVGDRSVVIGTADSQAEFVLFKSNLSPGGEPAAMDQSVGEAMPDPAQEQLPDASSGLPPEGEGMQ
jgi:hypothetical protein